MRGGLINYWGFFWFFKDVKGYSLDVGLELEVGEFCWLLFFLILSLKLLVKYVRSLFNIYVFII